ncbi:MAG: hypothetical protein J6U93_05150 [Alistipes sp.]|nr:hypothetical protein [Alistipes sp.]
MAEVFATGPAGQRYYSRRQYNNARTGYELAAAGRNARVNRPLRNLRR